MRRKLCKYFVHVTNKFTFCIRKTNKKMNKQSQEEKFKAMKLPELKTYLQNWGITVILGRTRNYSMCCRRNESSSALSSL